MVSSALKKAKLEAGRPFQLHNGNCLDYLREIEDDSIDLTLTSPPYCIGKAYDVHTTIEGFLEINEPILELAYQKTKPGGAICWQVGHHVTKGEIIPLDYVVYDIIRRKCPDAKLRNRIIWHFGHGANCRNRFSGRHETVLWFTKGDDYYFDLDSVRIPQKYPGKKYYKGSKKGLYSCNPLGKNPGDTWEIPNIKANHIEKTEHPCQFPIALAQRLIRALSPHSGVVLDPFMGAGSSGAAAMLEGRNYLGIELDTNYYSIAEKRIVSALDGTLKYRSIDKPILEPSEAGSVAKIPDEWRANRNKYES